MWERIRKQLWQAINGSLQNKTTAPAIDEEVAEQIQELVVQNRHLNALLQEDPHPWRYPHFKNETALQELLQAGRDTQRDFVLAAIAHLAHVREPHFDRRYHPLLHVVKQVLQRRLSFSEADLILVVYFFVHLAHWTPLELGLMRTIDRYLNEHELTPQIDQALKKLVLFLDGEVLSPRERGRLQRLQTRLGITGLNIPLHLGDVWGDALIDELSKAPPDQVAAWCALLGHCATLTSATPSAKWQSSAQNLITPLGADNVSAALLRWFPLVDKPRTTPVFNDWDGEMPSLQLIHHNLDALRGLVWLGGQIPSSAMARALTAVAFSCYRKLPGLGVRCARVGNAAIGALASMPDTLGLEQLALLKGRVRGKQPQQLISKALEQTAKAQGISVDELSELMVPSYCLDAVGYGRKVFGEYQAEVQIEGSTVAVQWSRGDGKTLRSLPKAAKEEYGEEIKEFLQEVADLKKMLPSQRDRIEQSYLSQRSWRFATWRERYLEHPLLGNLAGRLIWHFAQGEQAANGMWHAGEIKDHKGHALTWIDDTCEVTLWHPLQSASEEIVAWRAWLNQHEIQQPFKQAYREVYLLTDAERQTHTYSNRFAAHIVRQYQYNSLCEARAWRNQLRLAVDADYPPCQRLLAHWNLRAEFWVEPVGSTYGVDTSTSGVYLYLSTDQVRFYHIDAAQHYAHATGGGYYPAWHTENLAEPLPLEQIPALVFSEIMRDVDLFVGVASIGNDPTWVNGRMEADQERHRTYWQEYSSGALSESAKMRKQVLEQIIPRLKIAQRCQLSERFLEVRGDLHSYKIHLGSGNILITDNNQYLCIVPSQQAQAHKDKLFLPFEGDTMLSIILSKALMLADDTTIKDRSILSQLRDASSVRL